MRKPERIVPTTGVTGQKTPFPKPFNAPENRRENYAARKRRIQAREKDEEDRAKAASEMRQKAKGELPGEVGYPLHFFVVAL